MRRVLAPVVMLAVCVAIVGIYNCVASGNGTAPAVPQVRSTPAASPTLKATLTPPPSPTRSSESGTPTTVEYAPDFALTSVLGEVTTLSGYRGQKNVVLLFYRTGG